MHILMLLRHTWLIRIGFTVGLGLGPARDDLVLVLKVVFFLEGLASAVERNKRFLGDSSFTNRALAGVDIGVAKPFVDARPAVEVTAESHHRLSRKVQADVTIEATAGGGGRSS
jgi:hypothetical protein